MDSIPSISVRRTIKDTLSGALGRAGLKLVRTGPRPFQEFRDYIPYEQTVTEAKARGLSAGDYIDQKYGRSGVTQETVDRLESLGVVHRGVRRICEIGPGSGRYLERVKRVCSPNAYEIYETAAKWRDHLVREHGVLAQPTDGRSLSATPNGSVDLVHAHKVFPGLPFLVAQRYFREMVRVASPGGKVVFDAVTENCMKEATVERWLASNASYDTYPTVMPRQCLLDFFAARGFRLKDTFMISMEPGTTEYFVFTLQGD
jgi:hypothetical protein